MRYLKIAIILILVVISGNCKSGKVATNPKTSVATNPKTSDDTLTTLTLQADNIIQGVDTAIEVKRALLKEGLITKDLSLSLSNALLTIAYADKQFAKRLKNYQTFDATSKSDLAKLFLDLVEAVEELNQVGVVNLNPQLASALTAITTALSVMKPIFGVLGDNRGKATETLKINRGNWSGSKRGWYPLRWTSRGINRGARQIAYAL